MPLLGGTVSADATKVVVADPHRDRIWWFDPVEERVVGEVALDAGATPFRVALDAGRAYVTLRGTGELAMLEAGTLVARRSVCRHPRGVGAADGQVWVACAGGWLVVLDTMLEELDRIWIAPDLRDVVVDGDVVWVSTFRRAAQWPLDRSTGELGAPLVPVTEDAEATVAWRLVGAPEGGTWMLHQAASREPVGEASAPMQPSYAGGAGCRSEENPGPTVSMALTRVDAEGSVEPARPLRGVGLATDLAVSEVGDWIWTVGTRSGASRRWGSFVVGDKWRHDPCLPIDLDVAVEGPATSVALAGADGLGWVYDIGAGQLVHREKVFALASGTLPDLGPLTLFHADPGAGVTCAHCHPEGQDDGHVWRFADGRVRRTQNLAGGVPARGPLHWGGELEDFGVLMDEVFVEGMGGRPLSEKETGELVRWLEGIEPVERSVRVSEATWMRGRALFEDPTVGCARCHEGSQYSDHRLHDVFGDGRWTKTPSLRGVGTRWGLMHDGCATDVAHRLRDEACGGLQHGGLGNLSAEDIDALAAYVQSL